MAGIPSLHKFRKRLMAMQEGNYDLPSPSDVWKVSNETGSDAFYGGRLKIEQVRKMIFLSSSFLFKEFLLIDTWNIFCSSWLQRYYRMMETKLVEILVSLSGARSCTLQVSKMVKTPEYYGSLKNSLLFRF